MSDHTPTDADRQRDLLADLAVCEAATAGPWLYQSRDTDRHGYVTADVPPHRPGARTVLISCGWLDDAPGQDAGAAANRANARMIAAAREGWPAAIGRAIAAEEVLRSLEWSGTRGVRDEPCCPCCSCRYGESHRADCQLALAIGARRETP